MQAAVINTSKYGINTSKYGTISKVQTGSVLDVVFFNNSTDINLYDNRVQSDLLDLVTQLENDSKTKVVVFRSDNAKFFFGILDILPSRPNEPDFPTTDPKNPFNAFKLFYNISQLPMTTIAAIDGQANGIGNEFLLACDMRFATKEKSKFSQVEVPLGTVPGAGGVQNLARLIGRGRAIEYILSGFAIGAEEAERIGWINRAFDTATEMNKYIDALAQRIALYPLDATSTAKRLINSVTFPTLEELASEQEAFVQTFSTAESQKRIQEFTLLSKNETSVPFLYYVADHITKVYS